MPVRTTDPIDVDGQAGQLQGRDRLGDEGLVVGDERGQRLLGELLEPVGDGPRRRDPGQATEATHVEVAVFLRALLRHLRG